MTQQLVSTAVEMRADVTNAVLCENSAGAVKVERDEWNPRINEYATNRRSSLYLDRKINGLRLLEFKNVENMTSVHIHRNHNFVYEKPLLHHRVPKVVRHNG